MSGAAADIRWKQRFDHFDKAYATLADALGRDPDTLSDLEKMGCVQAFELTFELAWKTLKDYLVYEGVDLSPPTPRTAIKEGVAFDIIGDGQIWIDMQNERNLTTHTYHHDLLEKSVGRIRTIYFPAIAALHDFFQGRRP